MKNSLTKIPEWPSGALWNLVRATHIALVFVLFLLWTATPQGQEMPVPVNVQVTLFVKILTFDRNLKAEPDGEIVIGVVFQKRHRRSLNTKDEFMRAISSIKEVNDLRFRCVPIDIGDRVDLADTISAGGIDVLYIAPLRAVEMETITSVSRAQRVTTLTGVPGYVEWGLAVGIGMKGERPRIIINRPAAKAEGANFRSQLLKLASVIH